MENRWLSLSKLKKMKLDWALRLGCFSSGLGTILHVGVRPRSQAKQPPGRRAAGTKKWPRVTLSFIGRPDKKGVYADGAKSRAERYFLTRRLVRRNNASM